MTETAASEGAVALLEAWLTQLGGIRDLSPRTLTAYRRDVSGYLGFLTRHFGGPCGAGGTGAGLHLRYPGLDGA